MKKRGSALLYVIFAIMSFSLIISYILLRTGTSEISQLTYTSEIIKIYNDNYQDTYIMMQKAYTPPDGYGI